MKAFTVMGNRVPLKDRAALANTAGDSPSDASRTALAVPTFFALVALAIAIALTATACSPMQYTSGVPNLAQVDANIWRSGQITSHEGWDYIAELARGRRVHVIKLNYEDEGDDNYAEWWLGFHVIHYPIQPDGDQDIWDDFLDTFLHPDQYLIDAAVEDLCWCAAHPNTDMCLAHCTHGQDRTGLVIGEYRVKCDGWTKRRAYGEMLAYNFHPELLGLQLAWLALSGGAP